MGSNRVVTVPDTMEIIRHEINPIDMGLHGIEIEVAEIPIRRGRCECNDIVAIAGINSRAELFEKSDVVLTIIITTAAVIGTGILPI